MCTINKKTDLKTVTVYKAVFKTKAGNYYARYSGVRIKVGAVKPQTLADYRRNNNRYYYYYNEPSFYNKNMVGKCSGFKDCECAKKILPMVLRVVLGGEIWEGNATNISPYIHNDEVVYAGTEIISFEEVS